MCEVHGVFFEMEGDFLSAVFFMVQHKGRRRAIQCLSALCENEKSQLWGSVRSGNECWEKHAKILHNRGEMITR